MLDDGPLINVLNFKFQLMDSKMNWEKEPFSCPYLATVNRSCLDFDFEKRCSVSLSDFNIYACLVCGRYFQGRGRSSPAYFHSLNDNHHVFINLQDRKVFYLTDCLINLGVLSAR